MAAEHQVEEPRALQRAGRPAPAWWSHPGGPEAQCGPIFGGSAGPGDGGPACRDENGGQDAKRRSRRGTCHDDAAAFRRRPRPAPALGSPRGLLVIAFVVLVASLLGGGLGVAIEGAAEGGRLTLHQSSGATNEPAGRTAQVLHAVLPGVVYLQVDAGGQRSTGTGILLDANGHILTNNHVVAPEGTVGTVTVTFSTGQRHPAAIIGRDAGSDLAVLRVSGVSGLTPATFGDSDNVQVGEPVMAIGAPYGLRGTVTSGIVSAVDRPIVSGSLDSPAGHSYLDALQTDAPINPGNSGGPLLDASGTVIGINTVIRSSDPDSSDPYGSDSTSGSIGLGFAIPIDQATQVAAQLIGSGRSTPPNIGVTLDRGFDGGAKVTEVRAHGSKLRVGDVITAADGVAVTDADDLIALIRGRKPTGTTVLTVLRDGASLRIQAKLSSGPTDTTSTQA
ncbi:S1C family serine protease [Streptacidiphilus jiangxiensis]|uniref:Putative serine protease PepD n=1 Tax=Streptacidiphilus jiangxiensis TaxID=235985 RepID=A0A1H7FUR0_STRJI|nr:trypsin-like peptidase domain-containing protein [Streptacidiphilus jiangxiensis]SEK28977.1 putative serine protease PepD [Streptacidiphilus jiangxiensis]